MPAVAAEQLSQLSWVSESLLPEILVDPTNYRLEEGVVERVGCMDLVSKGVVQLKIHPYKCNTVLRFKLHVTDHPHCGDVLIGHEDELQLQSARNAAASHYADPEYHLASGMYLR